MKQRENKRKRQTLRETEMERNQDKERVTLRMREIERDWSSKRGDTIMVLYLYAVIIS